MILHRIFTNQQFSTLFDNASIGILIVNNDCRIEAANKYIVREFGYDTNELIEKPIDFLIPQKKIAQCFALNDQCTHSIAPAIPDAQYDLTATRKDGTKCQIEVSLGSYLEKDAAYYFVFINDINRQKEAETTIKRLNAELDQKVKESTRSLQATVAQLSSQIKENERKDAELTKALEKEKELNELKSRFVSMASHEFRTPLAGILASTYLISRYTGENDQPQRDKHIKRILSSVNLLNEVLGDFLSVDKIEEGNFKPNLTEFNISAEAREIIQNMQYMLKPGQQILLTNNKDWAIAYLDHSMFNHILTNLLSNAIKYSPEDSRIDLIIEQDGHTLTIRVRDQGIGIPAEEQANLYKKFFRCKNAANVQGTGLGLNIVRKYVDVLDGAIACISEENKGTEFIITFNNQTEHNENSISC